MTGVIREKAEQDRVLEELIKNTKNQMKELSFSYEKLGNMLKKMPDRHWNLVEDERRQILGRISIEACEGCSRFYRCYRQEKDQLLEEVRQLLDQMERGRREKRKIPDSFEQRCLRTEKFLEVLSQSYEIVGIHRSWQNKMLYQRRAMASQMAEMSRLLFDCSAMMGYDKRGGEYWEKIVKKSLRREKILLSYIRFYENSNKRKEVYLTARTKKGKCSARRIADILSAVLKVPMVPARECRIALYEETALLHFSEDVNYCVLTGVSQLCKNGETVCGDLFSVIRQEKGKELFLLTDGMGSGSAAMEESRQTMELMEQLLGAGVREEEALRISNTAITFGMERAMYASVDLLSFNLFTGVIKMMKAGSAATFLVRKDRVEVVASRTLPAGLLWEVEFDVHYKKLYDGDSIVLVSDGVLDSISGENPEELLKQWLPCIYSESPQKAADRILVYALDEAGGRRRDDMSVMVIHSWKKNHSMLSKKRK